jgi:peptide deformylase
LAVKEILLLGNSELHEKCRKVERSESEETRLIVRDLRDTMMAFRERHGFGRAIAAPQIGVKRRIVYMQAEEAIVFVNPVLTGKSREMIEVWDDCMSFPDLLVRVERHNSCRIEYLDLEWNRRELNLEGDLSELLQHECDHLDGVLAVERAIDGRSFALRGSTSRFPRRISREPG